MRRLMGISVVLVFLAVFWGGTSTIVEYDRKEETDGSWTVSSETMAVVSDHLNDEVEQDDLLTVYAKAKRHEVDSQDESMETHIPYEDGETIQNVELESSAESVQNDDSKELSESVENDESEVISESSQNNRAPEAVGMIADQVEEVVNEVIIAGEDTIPASVPVAEKAPVDETDRAEKIELAHRLVSWQLSNGGWWKNNDDLYKRQWDGVEQKSGSKEMDVGTLDNYATIPEIRKLAEIHSKYPEAFIESAVLKAFDYLHEMQYDTGAFPHYYPYEPFKAYVSYGTFDDDATSMVMMLYKDILEGAASFSFLPDHYIARIRADYAKGIDYILNTQIEVDGVLTGWCGQHDPYTYEPRNGRSFELASISGFSTISNVDLLLVLEEDDPRIKGAIESALAWLDLVGKRNTSYKRFGEGGKYFVYDAKLIVWYRFYEIDTFRPFFANRDGEKVYSIEALDAERRDGYAWACSYGMHLIGE